MRQLFIILIAACSLAVTAHAQDTNLFKTDIELFEAQPDRVIVKGIGEIGSISTVAGGIDVHCRESTDTSTGHKLYGAIFDYTGNGGRVRLFVDYSEMDSFLGSIDYLMRVTSDVTTLPSFSAEFTTKSGLHVIAYSSRKQGNIQIFIQFCDFPRIQLTTDQVSQFRDLVSSAKITLDNLAAGK
jgi:hypothetical protein